MNKLFCILPFIMISLANIYAMEKPEKSIKNFSIPSLRSLSLLQLAKTEIRDEKQNIVDLSSLQENDVTAIVGENDSNKLTIKKFSLESIPQQTHSFLILISLIKSQKKKFKTSLSKKRSPKEYIKCLRSLFNYNKQQFYTQVLELDSQKNNKNLKKYFADLLNNPNTIHQWKKSTFLPFFINFYGINLTCCSPPVVSAKNMRTIIIKSCKKFYANFDLEKSTISCCSTAKDNDCFQSNDNDLIDLKPMARKYLYNINLKSPTQA